MEPSDNGTKELGTLVIVQLWARLSRIFLHEVRSRRRREGGNENEILFQIWL